jgi:hypothetical protein
VLLPTCVVICRTDTLSISLRMSLQDSISIPAKQSPVINRLHDCMTQALAYAHAIRDNAQDDSQPIPLELVGSFQVDCDAIINALSEAAAQ